MQQQNKKNSLIPSDHLVSDGLWEHLRTVQIFLETRVYKYFRIEIIGFIVLEFLVLPWLPKKKVLASNTVVVLLHYY